MEAYLSRGREKIIEQMRQAGIVPVPYKPDDLQELAEEYGEDFLQSKREAIPWKETTYKDYESIFNKKVKPLLRGLNPFDENLRKPDSDSGG